MADASRVRVAIIGSGNIGSDLMAKVARSELLELVGVAGIDPASDGLARARAAGVTATHDGLADLLDPCRGDRRGVRRDLRARPRRACGAARGARHPLDRPDSRGARPGGRAVGQPRRPRRRAGRQPDHLRRPGDGADRRRARRGGAVRYAEIVSTVAARSAGPGTRANIDEFTQSTASALETVGGARAGKAIILLNPADPPIMMRNTIYAELDDGGDDAAIAAVEAAVAAVAEYVPGYHLTNPPLVDGDLVTVLLEVEGAGDYLPRYAGNLDIMTAAAVRVAESYATALV